MDPTQEQQPTDPMMSGPSSTSDGDAGLMGALSSYEGQLGKMQDLGVEQAQSIKSEEQQLQQSPVPQNNSMLSSMPFLLALTAIGGAVSGLHGRVMLGALTGMAKGAVNGDEQAFNDSLKTYQAQRQKLIDLGKLQDEYYQSMYNAYGRTAEGQMQAIMMVRQITGDELKDRLAMDHLKIDQVNSFTTQQRLMAEIAHNRHMENLANAKLALQWKTFEQQYGSGSQLSDSAIDFGAQRLLHGQSTGFQGWGQSANLARIKMYNRAGEAAAKMPGGISGTAARGEVFKGLGKEMTQLMEMQGKISTFEDSARRQMQIVQGVNDKVSRSDSPAINKALMYYLTQGTSDPNATKLQNSIAVFSAEYAKVMTGQTTGQAVSDSARSEAQKITDATMAGETLSQVLSQELHSMHNRMASFNDQIGELQKQMSQINSLSDSSNPAGEPAPVGANEYGTVDALKAAFARGEIGPDEAAAIMNYKGWKLQ